MLGTHSWNEVESEVHQPARRFGFWFGGFFLAMAVLLLVIPSHPPLFGAIAAGVIGLIGGASVGWSIVQPMFAASVRHAAPDVLPNVPNEPILREGTFVHGRLTHELVEDVDGWDFRPDSKLWRDSRNFVFGFGIPFSVFFTGLLSWHFHSHLNVRPWPLALLLGTFVTAVCGGSAFALLYMILRGKYRQLDRLSIPRNGGDLKLDVHSTVRPDRPDVSRAYNWLFRGQTEREQLTIPRQSIVAVQLCPWKYVVGTSRRPSIIASAVQGLLVLAPSADEVYPRLPILVTGDFAGAAQLMLGLADTLNVPFLFGANAEGWKAEELRAKNRLPLRSGGCD